MLCKGFLVSSSKRTVFNEPFFSLIKVGAVNLVEHSRLCIAADQCDAKYLSLNKRLHRLAKELERMLPDGGSAALVRVF
jgi:hypothetical protein